LLQPGLATRGTKIEDLARICQTDIPPDSNEDVDFRTANLNGACAAVATNVPSSKAWTCGYPTGIAKLPDRLYGLNLICHFSTESSELLSSVFD